MYALGHRPHSGLILCLSSTDPSSEARVRRQDGGEIRSFADRLINRHGSHMKPTGTNLRRYLRG